MNRTCNNAGDYSAFAKHRNNSFSPGFRRPKYNVPVNIDESENYYTISVYASGFDKENIKLSTIDEELYINGTRTIDEENKPTLLSRNFR